MAMAAAVLGLAVPGVVVEDVGTVAKTMPDFTTLWGRMLVRAGRGGAPDGPVDAAPTTSPTSGSAPAARNSRPRTKDRPAHEDAVPGRVTGVDRGRYTTLVERRRRPRRVVIAMRARELGRKGIVVGDDVHLVGDTTGADGSLARIVRIAPRETVLRRTADDTDPVERVLVANADQLVVVSALANPEPRPRLIDRCLVAAYDAGMEPLLVLTKADLTDPAPFLEQYAPLSVRHVVTARHDGTHRRARRAARGARRAGSACSSATPGVGKSTLVNALVPLALRATGVVNDVTGRGGTPPPRPSRWPCPTTTAGSSTPRACGPSGWPTSTWRGSSSTSPTSSRAPQQCPRGCTHDEEECALDAWVDERRRRPGRARRAWTPCAACCAPARRHTGD